MSIDKNLYKFNFSISNKQRMMNCVVLQRNFAECVDACQTNLDPTERTRHYTPSEAISKEPLVRDFGRFAQDMAWLKI